MNEDNRPGRGLSEGSRRSHFKKGKSGNPKGRPRAGWNSIPDYLNDALSEIVTVFVNGRKKRMTKIEAMLMQLANRGAAGDFRSIKQFFEMASKFKSMRSDRPEPMSAPLPPPDDLKFWAEVVDILYDCGAMRFVPEGLIEAIGSADWAKMRQIAGRVPEPNDDDTPEPDAD